MTIDPKAMNITQALVDSMRAEITALELELAARKSAELDNIERRESEWKAPSAAIDLYTEDYEYREFGYTPTEYELAICYDFVRGLISDDAFIAAIAQVYPVRSKFAAMRKGE